MEDWHLPLLAGKCFPRAGRGEAAGLIIPVHSPSVAREERLQGGTEEAGVEG